MARLPNPGSDSGTWGDILNEYLSQSLKSDGTIQDNAVTANNLAPNSVTNEALASNAVNATIIADGSITEVLLDTSLQNKINAPPSAPVTSVAGKTGVVSLVKADIGLANVDNTSDADKPVSTAAQTILNTKLDKISTANRLYGTGGAGEQTIWSLSRYGTPGTIMYRDPGTGTSEVGTPTSAAHATTKEYVDTGLASKASVRTDVNTPINLLKDVTLDMNPESTSFTFVPVLFNDLAFNTQKGGSISFTKNGSNYSPSGVDNAFRLDSTYVNSAVESTNDTFVITVNSWRTFNYGNNYGIAFASSSNMRARNIIIEAYYDGSWTQIYSITDALSPVHRVYFDVNGSSTVTAVRYTLSNVAGSLMRISSLYICARNSSLLSSGYLSLDGGTVYGSISTSVNPTDDSHLVRKAYVDTAAAGKVSGAVSSANNAVARFDGTTGKIIKDSSVTIGDGGTLSVADGTVYLNNAGSNAVNIPSGSFLRFGASNSAYPHVLVVREGYQGGAGRINFRYGGDGMTFDYANGTSAETRIKVDVDGNMGWGTTSPTHSLTLSSGATGITAYGTADQVTNYERVRQYWDGSVYRIMSEAVGNGTIRSISVNGGSSFVNLTGSGLVMGRGNTSNGNIVTAQAVFIASSGMQNMVSVTPTINQTNTAGYTALLVNPTETATGSGTKLLADFQVGGVSRARIDKSGVITAAAGTVAGSVVTIDGAQTLTNKTFSDLRIEQLKDTNGYNILGLYGTSNPVNQFYLTNQSTGNYPTFGVDGSDTDIGITLAPKNNASVRIYAPTGITPTLDVGGPDTNIDLNLRTQGSGVVRVNGAQVMTTGGVLPVASGGTGSSTQNFVDLSTNQTIAGNKTLSGTTYLSGGIKQGVITRTGSATLGTTSPTVELCDATTASYNITLPTAISNSGITFTVVKTDATANTVTLTTAASQTINGASTHVLSAQWQRVTVISNGTNWIIIG